MNYKNRVYDAVTIYMKKLDELDGLERGLAAQERAETISRVHAAERRRQRQPQPQDAPASKLCRADEQQIVHRSVEQERLVGVHCHLHRLPLFVPASPA